MSAISRLPEGCELINFCCVRDERGALTFVQAEDHIPFSFSRIFWIFDVPQGKSRGGHAHRECSEVVVPVKGAFTMRVDNGVDSASVRMETPNQGILIPAGMWCELTDFTSDAVLVVLASHPYDAQGYVHDYNKYKEEWTR